MRSKKLISRNIFVFILIFVITTAYILAGNIYYIDSTNGNDNNDGFSTSTSWKTLGKANSSLLPGDTVYIRAGIYNETISPKNSGIEENYITYRNYEEEEVIIDGLSQGVLLDNKEFIAVIGLKISNAGRFVVIQNGSKNNIIQNCNMQGSSNWGGVRIENSSHNKILDNYIYDCHGDAVELYPNADYNLIQGNEVDGGPTNTHSCLSIWSTTGQDYSSYNIVRNNHIHDPCDDGMNMLQKVDHNLVENNIFYNVSNGAGLKFCGGQNNIIRRNIAVDCKAYGIGIYASLYGGYSSYGENNTFYNNIILGSDRGSNMDAGFRFLVYEGGGEIRNNIVKNNVIYENNPQQIYINGDKGYKEYAAPNSFINNTIYNISPGQKVINYMGLKYSIQEIELQQPSQFTNNIDAYPDFVDANNKNFLLKSGSPCINTGDWLTVITSSGSGTQIPVEDAGYFCDGFGIIDGDLIQLEGQTQTAKITNVDYSNNIITVDTPLSWYSGQGVSMPYYGYAPDIGAYEYYETSAPLTASMDASPGSGFVPFSVSFTGSATGGSEPYTYNWDFGDGNSSTDQNPSHTYSEEGDYTVIFTITDDSSQHDTDSIIINASEETDPLETSCSASPAEGEIPFEVTFTGSASGGTAPYSYSWNFGDGASSTAQNPSHTYTQAETYTITLTVTDSNDSQSTASTAVTASTQPPPLSVSCSGSPASGIVPLVVSFTGNASGGTAPYSYSWNFGDGASSTAKNPTHTYTEAGTYTITLTVTDSTASQASASTTVTAQAQIPSLAASCTASPTSGDIPLTVNFTGTATGGISPYSYSWNFGDGASSTAQNPSHTYTQAGTYTVTLTVTDSTTTQASASTAITASSPVHEVTAPDTPEGPSTGAPGVSYTYTTGGSSCSQGHNVEYYFDWGDGTYSSWSSSTSASHIWSSAGTYAVKVQARCSVNPGVTSMWSAAKTVSLEESPNFQLNISSATASPAPGQGGSTNPDTGSYPYPAGNSIQVTALPATNYRFSKWTGDITGSDSYNSEITFNMDQDKSISALFCTQCGDVNGDLNITPADAQYVFEMFLGIISSATETQKENADVNCDGTAIEPNITPADAQAIFEKFLGISELPGDCSCRSRADASSTASTQNNQSQTASLEIQPGTNNIQLSIDDIDARFRREITVPVRINNPLNIKSFGFDLIFDSATLEFVGIEIGSLLNGFTMVDANEISEGVVRVGGFSSEPIMTSSPSVLVRLKFRVSGRVKEPSPLSIINTVDDIKNATTRSGVVFIENIKNKIKRNRNVF